MNQPIDTFGKNAAEEASVSLTQFKGYDLIDLRVYYCATDGEPIPTKKGVTMSIELYPNLRDAILKLGKELEKQGQS